MKQAAALIATAALFFAIGTQVDVQTATVALWDRAANRTDPTGRAFDADVKNVVGEEMGRWMDLYFGENACPVP